MSQGWRTAPRRGPCKRWSHDRLRSNSRSSVKFAGLTILLGSLLLGCGPQAYEGRTAVVSGKVSLNGAVLPAGNVLFMDDDGHAASAIVAEDGSYTTRARPGQYKVAVTPPELIDPLTSTDSMAQRVNIPKRYHDVGLSELAVQLKEGDNQFDIPLSK